MCIYWISFCSALCGEADKEEDSYMLQGCSEKKKTRQCRVWVLLWDTKFAKKIQCQNLVNTVDLVRCIKQKMDRVHNKGILGKIKQILFQSIELVLIVKKPPMLDSLFSL